ncbi:MAG: Gfo/Idh/MocA family oxidoreductase [Clostridiales bacterium]|nr:Gfo/Idh/MocA family oxidoreductase [Clostridiales bacterium]
MNGNDTEKAETIKWGIMGSGGIVDRWMRGAIQCSDMEIAAIASRNPEHARQKAEQYYIPVSATYEQIVKMPEIQAVYIAALHTAHKELAILAMENGKSVLVEKPAAVNAADLGEMLDCAKRNHVFFMEAIWTRFFPLMRVLKAEIGRGTIGEVRDLQSSFSFRVPADHKESRLLNPDLAGGGLLDVGVYNLHFANEVFGKYPVCMWSLATIDSDENHIQVDEQACYIAQYDKGELATMSSGVRTAMVDAAFIYGTGGYIEIPQFWKPTQMKIVEYPEDFEHGENIVREVQCPVEQRVPEVEDEGYQYEIRHVNECIRAGKCESPVMPWEKSMEIVKECDELRRQWGLEYPFEKQSGRS